MRLQVAVTEKNERLGPTSTPVMKFSVSQRHGVIPSDELENRTMQAKSLEKYKVVAEDDLVLNRFNAYKGALGLAPGTGVVSPDYFVAVVNPTLADARFIRYFLLAQPSAEIIRRDMGGMGSGDPDSSAFARFDVRSLLSMEVAIDDLGAQRAIADYLDRETAEIDAMTADLDELEKLLTERRVAIIALHVFGEADDLAPRLPLKVVTARTFAGEWGKEAGEQEHDRRCVRVADFDRHTNLVSENVPTVRSYTSKNIADKTLRTGDLLIEKSGGTNINPVGNVIEYVGADGPLCSNFIQVVRLNNQQHPRYWQQAHLAAYETGVTNLYVNQTTGIQNLDMNGFTGEKFPVPPLETQRRIAEEIDHETAEIDAMLADITALRDLLAERRAALIAAAVTGQIDIPTPEEPTHA